MTFPAAGILLDILKGSVATIALFLAYASVPLVGVFGGMLAPLPGILYTLRRGRAVGVAIVLATGAVLVMVADLSALSLYLVQCASVSLLLPLFLSERSTARAIVYTAAGSVAAIGGLGIGYGLMHGVNIDAEVLKWINTSISHTATLYEKSGLKGDELQNLQQGLQQAGQLLGRVYPAMVVFGQLVIVIVNVLAMGALARRWQLPVPLNDFRQFRNPDQLIWVVIAAGFTMLIDNDAVTRGALNVLLVGLFAYFIQGMAIMAHFFARFAVSRIAKFFFYLFLVLQPYLTIGVAVLGLFDLWGNFRTPKQKNL